MSSLALRTEHIICRLCSYGLGILLRTYSWDDLRTSGPWLLGSLGVVLLDVLISLQVPPPYAAAPPPIRCPPRIH